jgi:signal transduction histidine kinase
MDPGELRRIAILSDLPDERLRELAQHGIEQTYRAGEYVFHGQEEAVYWWLLLEGELETTIDVAGDELPLLHHPAGGFLGAISILTGELLRGSTRAAVDSRLFLVEPDAFRRLLVTEPTVFKAVMDVFVPVISDITAIERDRDRLLSLGTLAAGLAHELNNPAAAAQRAASELEAADVAGQRALSGLAAHGVGADAIARLCQLTSEALGEADGREPLAGLGRADRVTAVTSWLAERGLADGVAAADALVDAGLDEAWVERLLAVAPDAQEELLAWVASRLTAARIAHELADSTGRISQLVQSVRQYSYLDQAPRQEVDVHDGLESTLAILAHKVAESAIEIVREYDRSLPHIETHAPELNQVWTNLIDNAVAAAGKDGRVTIRTRRAGDFLVVEVEDDGPGIPEDVVARVFDPFFTTKPPGEGTGLGLDIARRIVVRHRGDLRLKPVDRGACFQVLLPLAAN